MNSKAYCVKRIKKGVKKKMQQMRAKNENTTMPTEKKIIIAMLLIFSLFSALLFVSFFPVYSYLSSFATTVSLNRAIRKNWMRAVIR